MPIVVYGDQDFLTFCLPVAYIVFASEQKDDVTEMTPNIQIQHIYAFCPFPTHGNIPLMNW